MKEYEITIEAAADHLPQVMQFIEQHLEEVDCPVKSQMQISIAVEEIFVNVAHYAYQPGKGDVTVRIGFSEEPAFVQITFADQGIPYDPLAKTDPDVTVSVKERQVGGLGIFMTKKMMDEMAYERRDGWNILQMKKNLS